MQTDYSTLDGLTKIVRAKRAWMKLYWSSALLIVLGMYSFVLIKAVLDYFAYEVVTTITVRNEIPARMPTIMICNVNSLLTPTAVAFAKQIYTKYDMPISNNYLNFTYGQQTFARILNNKANILLPRSMVMAASLNLALSNDFRKTLSLSMQDMLISCTFNSVECTSDDFTWYNLPYFGYCFQFQPNTSSGISQTGKFHGLKMELFVGQATLVEQLAQKNGLHLYIVNETETFNFFKDSVEVAAGKETTILLNKKRIRKMQKPYGECTYDLTSVDSYSSELYALTFQIYGHYRQSDCFNTCFQAASIRRLGCYSSFFPYLRNSSTPACLKGLELFDSLAFYTKFFIGEVAENCTGCPLECDSEFYSLTTSSLAYPTQIYAKMLANQSQIQSRFNNISPTYGQLKQSLASVNINYNQLGYTQIKEIQKVTILDLVTNIGSALGLFVGVSFLSLFEIVELLIRLVSFMFHRCFLT